MWRQKSWGSTKRKNLKVALRFKHVQNAYSSIIIFIRQIFLWTEQLFVTHVRALDNWTYSTFLSFTEELMAEAIRKVGCVDFGNRSSTLQNRENTQQKHVVSCGQVSGGKYCGGSEVVAVKLHPIRSVEGGYDRLKRYSGYRPRFCMIVKLIYDGALAQCYLSKETYDCT